jgi:hypothetical protein
LLFERLELRLELLRLELEDFDRLEPPERFTADDFDRLEPLERFTAGAFDFDRLDPELLGADFTRDFELDLDFEVPLYDLDLLELVDFRFTALPFDFRVLVDERGLYDFPVLRVRVVDFRSTALLLVRVVWLLVFV